MPTRAGAQYRCTRCGAEMMVTRGGEGELVCCGRPMQEKK